MANWTRKRGRKKLTRKEREALPPEQRRKPGRPPGIHTPHRTPQERRAYLIEHYGSPVEYMLNVMVTAKEKSRRDDMAKAAAPYVEAKMQTIELTGDQDKPVVVQRDLSKLSDSELAAQFAAMIAAKKAKR